MRGVKRREVHLQAGGGLWPPSWPMGLTLLRLLLLPVFLYLLLADARFPDHDLRRFALGVFAVMALTDKLDGMLARRLHQTSKLGALLDPLADKLLIASSVILLCFPAVAPAGFVLPIQLVLAIYIKDVIVVLGVFSLLRLAGRVTISPRALGKAATALQLATVIATLLAPDVARVSGEAAWWLTRGLWWTTGAVTCAACIDYLVEGTRQARAGRAVDSAGVAARDAA